MSDITRPLRSVAWTCLAGVGGALILLWPGLGRPPAEFLIGLGGVAVLAAAAGLVACGLALWIRPSLAPVVLGVMLLSLGSLAGAFLTEGLDERSHMTDVKVCGKAERAGRTIARGERGYRERRDQDGDGLACEPIIGPQCIGGHCSPFG